MWKRTPLEKAIGFFTFPVGVWVDHVPAGLWRLVTMPIMAVLLLPLMVIGAPVLFVLMIWDMCNYDD